MNDAFQEELLKRMGYVEGKMVCCAGCDHFTRDSEGNPTCERNVVTLAVNENGYCRQFHKTL